MQGIGLGDAPVAVVLAGSTLHHFEPDSSGTWTYRGEIMGGPASPHAIAVTGARLAVLGFSGTDQELRILRLDGDRWILDGTLDTPMATMALASSGDDIILAGGTTDPAAGAVYFVRRGPNGWQTFGAPTITGGVFEVEVNGGRAVATHQGPTGLEMLTFEWSPLAIGWQERPGAAMAVPGEYAYAQHHVALSGTNLAIALPYERVQYVDANPWPQEGTGGNVVLFTWSGVRWIQGRTVVPQGIADWDMFGYSVDLDGAQLIVGSPGDYLGQTLYDAGSAHPLVFG